MEPWAHQDQTIGKRTSNQKVKRKERASFQSDHKKTDGCCNETEDNFLGNTFQIPEFHSHGFMDIHVMGTFKDAFSL